MVLWNFGLPNKTKVLWTNLWYFTKHNGTSIYEEKKPMMDYQKLRNFYLNGKKLWNYTKIIEFFEHINSF